MTDKAEVPEPGPTADTADDGVELAADQTPVADLSEEDDHA